MITLPNVTLVCISSTHIEKSIQSLISTTNHIQFKSTKFITDADVVHSQIETIKCTKITSLKEYSRIVLFDLYNHVDTDFCMIVQHDSRVMNPNLWSDDFLKYDYIGAPWPLPGTDWMPDHRYMNSSKEVLNSFSDKYRVGNGGFSIRSKRLLTTPTRMMVPTEDTVSDRGYFYTSNEDWNICIYNRHLYENDGNVFAPYEVANIFSKEWGAHDTFGKHRIITS